MHSVVDVAWLQSRLGDSNVVALDATLPPVGVKPPVDTRGAYLSGHIPGAVFFDIDELSDHTTGLPHMLPSAEDFGRAMSAMGVGDGMTVVVYEQAPVFSAPRACWMLETFGAKDVHMLDGGLPAWRAARLPMEYGGVSRAPARFGARLDRAAVKSFAEMERLLSEKAQVVDARSAGRFEGTAPEPRAGLSSGHMPGSVSVPFTEVFAEGRLKDAAALRGLFEAKGLDLSRPVTTTCGSGVTAAVLKLALDRAGAREVTVYDGSWAEYAQQPGAVIEKG